MTTDNIVASLLSLAVDISDLREMPGNPRRGDVESVMRSYQRFGQRKPIIALRDGTVIAGNHQLKAAQTLGWNKIAVVFVDDDDATAKAFALADNRTSDLGTYDDQALVALLEEVSVDPDLLLATGYDVDDLTDLAFTLDAADIEQDIADTNYSRTVEPPIYEPTGEKPAISSLYDATHTDDLVSEINSNSALPPDVRRFLLAAAQRHTVFVFDQIAEFYAHAEPDVQQLMEKSGLVIIDIDDAIGNGFVRMDKRLTQLFVEEQQSDDKIVRERNNK